jgi:Fe2+ or Zn2+ uptake regulation protein
MTEPEHIRQHLKSLGLRPTDARVRILHSLETIKDHPTAEELVVRVNENGKHVGRATVYQNLERLMRAGVVRSVTSDDGTRRFDSAIKEHQHFVCARTGRVLDVQVDPELLKQLMPLDPETGEPLKDARVGQVRIEFHGAL